MKASVLVVDDNRSAAEALGQVLRRHDYAVRVVFDGSSAIAALDEGGVGVVLTDLRMEGIDGLDVLRHARRLRRPAEVVVLTGYGTVEAAVTAMRLGARDFLTKPVTPGQVLALLRQLGGESPGMGVLEGPSASAARLRRQVDAVMASDAPVMLFGEPGSGRAELARHLHQRGPAAERAMVAINAPRELTELDLARTGTLFLPSVDLMSASEQAEMARGLDRLGKSLRVIASANAGWSTGTSAGSRELYYRVAVLELQLPPLRERSEDIGPLLRARLAARGQPGPELHPSPEQLAQLQAHRWPGNLRELSALVERVMVFGADAWNIAVERASAPADPTPPLVEGFSLNDYLDRVEKSILERAIQQTGMDRNEMSRILSVERNTLRYKLNKYGLLER